MYQDKDFTGSRSFNEFLTSILIWESNSKLIFEVFIESFPWLMREMIKNVAVKTIIKMAGSSRKVTEKMVIECFKPIIPQHQFLGVLDIVEALKTHDKTN
jgi:hypothetical protein